LGFEPSFLERFSIRLKRHCEETQRPCNPQNESGRGNFAGLIDAFNADDGYGCGLRADAGGEHAGAIETALANHDAAQH